MKYQNVIHLISDEIVHDVIYILIYFRL